MFDFPKSAKDCPPSIAINDHQISDTDDSSTPSDAAIKGTKIDEKLDPKWRMKSDTWKDKYFK